MRFFKTHGFHKPLLREMLFRVQFITGVLLGLLLLENPIEIKRIPVLKCPVDTTCSIVEDPLCSN